MVQVELSPTIPIKAEHVDTYVKAICAICGLEEPAPVGEVTQVEMKQLIRAAMNHLVKQRQRETFNPADPE